MKIDALKIRLIGIGLLLLTFGFASYSSAQAVFDDDAQVQAGTIEKTREDDGYISISGSDYGFDEEVTRVYLDQEQIGVEVLAAGLIVRYTLDQNNTLELIEIIGPEDIVASIGRN